MKEAGSTETKVGSWHVNTCYGYDVTGGTFSGKFSTGVYFHKTGNVADGDLVGWFLNFDVLERLEATGACVHHQIAFDIVGFALF